MTAVTSFYGHRPFKDTWGPRDWYDVAAGFNQSVTLTAPEQKGILGQDCERAANLVDIILK